MRLDSHQHFWKYNSAGYPWIDDSMARLRADFMPADLGPLLESFEMDGCVLVQVRQTADETRWLLRLARGHDFIRGVVGWVDLSSKFAEMQLGELAADPRLKGVRHLLQDEPDDRFMLRSEFKRGIALLRDFGLTYDLLLYPRHLPHAVELVKEFPRQPFVLDHLAKPFIAKGELEPWATDLRRLAERPNICCKISGMVTEAPWESWKPEDFVPYLDVAFEAFGEDRVLFGSDWPVCLLASDYPSMANIVVEYASRLSSEAQTKLFGENAARFYSID